MYVFSSVFFFLCVVVFLESGSVQGPDITSLSKVWEFRSILPNASSPQLLGSRPQASQVATHGKQVGLLGGGKEREIPIPLQR